MAQETSPPLTVEQSLGGILAVLVAEREERLQGADHPQKTEAILAKAGLLASQISMLTGKKPDAVRKAIQRSRQAKKKRTKRNGSKKTS